MIDTVYWFTTIYLALIIILQRYPCQNIVLISNLAWINQTLSSFRLVWYNKNRINDNVQWLFCRKYIFETKCKQYFIPENTNKEIHILHYNKTVWKPNIFVKIKNYNLDVCVISTWFISLTHTNLFIEVYLTLAIIKLYFLLKFNSSVSINYPANINKKNF